MSVSLFAAVCLSMGLSGISQAQLVPNTDILLASADQALARVALSPDASDAGEALDYTGGKGLNFSGQGFWPHWEGRIGIVIDRPFNPLKDSFVLASPASSGLRLRSLHILSDYYVDGGFRATAGLVRGDINQAWWTTNEHGSGLNLSLQRIDSLGLAGASTQAQSAPEANRTSPYLGAGYSSRPSVKGIRSNWRFNADLGIITVNSNNIGRITRVLQGDQTLDALVRDLRLRPVIKVSVGYSF